METIGQARKYAVKNAIDYGRAKPGSIISKLMSTKGAKIGEMSKIAAEAADWANALSKEELQSEYSKYSDEFASEKKEKTEKTAKPKMELEGAVPGVFVTRFPPEPSGYMHLGHAKVAILEQEFKNIYNGKLLLYWDDSNPEKEKQEFVDSIRNDSEWLGVKFDKEIYASDNIEKTYDYARKLISDGKAYACSCNPERMKDGRLRKEGCEHRLASPEDNMKAFETMLKGELNEGDAVIRFKGDMKSENTTLRDPTLMRIKKDKHYRQGSKYCLWPLYDLNTPVNDFLNGVTDVIRDKNYGLRDVLYLEMVDALGFRRPRIHPEARLVITKNMTSKRGLNLLIKEGMVSGWDDPRLITIAALRRRGVRPEAIRQFVMRFGMSKSESHVDISMLMDENKKVVDQEAKRLYFVANPVKLMIEGANKQAVKINLHPTADMGNRSFAAGNILYLSEEDSKKLQIGAIFTLKNLYSVRVTKFDKEAIMASPSEEESKLKVQWVADSNKMPCQVVVPKPPLKEDGEFDKESITVVNGFVEGYASKLKEKEVVQFERFGFCVLDDKAKMSFIFMTK